MKPRPPHIVDDHLKAKRLLRRLELAPNIFGIDTETVGVDPYTESPVGRGRIFCWSIAWYEEDPDCPERAYVSADLLPLFAHWLASESVFKVGHNVFSFDLHMFANHGIPLRGIVGDTLRMSKLSFNHPDARHGLKPLRSAILGLEMQDYKELFSRPTPGKRYKNKSNVSFKTRELIPLDELPVYYPQKMETLYEYASLDAWATLLLYKHFNSRLADLGLGGLYASVWNPSLYTLVGMESTGIRFERSVCEQGIVACHQQQRPIEERLLKHVGWRPPNRIPNWNSTDDRVYLVYGSLPKAIPAHLRPLRSLGAEVSPVCGSLKAPYVARQPL
jgi:DNA polymerase I-like protein with 3'-5' exonuclease and polymerase domains